MGDFRDWPAIDRWATAISDHLDAVAERPAHSTPAHLVRRFRVRRGAPAENLNSTPRAQVGV